MTSTTSATPRSPLARLAWHPLVWLLCGLVLIIATTAYLIHRRIALVREFQADVESHRGDVVVRPGGPESLDEWLGDGARERYCPVVTSVSMDNTRIDDAWIAQLRDHPGVTALSIRRCPVRGSGFESFASCTEIAT